jgi:chaperonin GroEL (HSP60 family)
MDKMMVSGLGDVTITNDGATVLEQLEVEHPGAKMAVSIAKNQDELVGDGTTSSVIFAAQLLTVAQELIEQGIHPSIIVRGFRKAMQESLKILDKTAKSTEDPKILEKIAITTMNSKGIAGNKEFFAKLASDAMTKIKEPNKKVFDAVKDIIIIKKKGKSLQETELINGIVLEKEPVHPLMPKYLTGGLKIACVAQEFGIKRQNFQVN